MSSRDRRMTGERNLRARMSHRIWTLDCSSTVLLTGRSCPQVWLLDGLWSQIFWQKWVGGIEPGQAWPQCRGREGFVLKRDWNIDPVSRYTLLCYVTHYIFNISSIKIKIFFTYWCRLINHSVRLAWGVCGIGSANHTQTCRGLGQFKS